ncbi:MAG: hypothetical protein H0A75_06845 [Candidatus Methanofishera endochildressiae]|uniref:Uncharacterized protein n=1 Tax=Candidatus Methanofishera endochildressiae TaxID=2738884 RepID=A0A7Z0MP76_9GAMM|nr:hypothetical protein [Candidatus Methanofishera endochildressiae]
MYQIRVITKLPNTEQSSKGKRDPGGSNELGRWDLTTHKNLSPNTAWFVPGFKLQNGALDFAAASDTVYQLLPMVDGSPRGTPVSSTTKLVANIAEILLKALKIPKIKSNHPKGKENHKSTNRQNQSTPGKLGKPQWP